MYAKSFRKIGKNMSLKNRLQPSAPGVPLYHFGFIFLFLLVYAPLTAASLPTDIKLISSSGATDIYEFTMQNFHLEELTVNTPSFQKPIFDNAALADDPADFLPGRTLLFGIPTQGKIQISVLSVKTDQFYNKRIGPLPDPYENNNRQKAITFKTVSYNQPLLVRETPGQFRDIRTTAITLHPFRYNARSGTLTVMKRIRFKVTYSGNFNENKPFHERGKLDHLYASMLINYKRAQHWQKTKRRLAKTTDLPGGGPFYLFDISQDGLYKITPAVLTAAGVPLNNTPIDAICIYNNGGHKLSFATDQTAYNAPYSKQIATYAHDANQNGIFDDGDYLLFFAKGVNSYFYEAASGKFNFQENPFDDRNRFALTVGLSTRLAMEISPLPAADGASTQDFSTQRYHHEKDLYNLLNSGPDWYGMRFFGASMTRSIDFELPFSPVPGVTSSFTIRLKGGTGVKYQEPSYAYRWTVNLNNTTVLNNNRFTGTSIVSYVHTMPAGSIQKGSNSLSIKFNGFDLRNASSEAAVAYLDWFDLSFNAINRASGDYFHFFTETQDHPVHYSISGFGSASDLIALDVTEATHPRIILDNASTTNGNLDILLPASSPREIVSARLGSPQIKEITSFKSYSPRSNLTDTNNRADYLIITRNSLLDYGKQIGNLRKNLISKAVSVEDIYLYFNSGVHDPTAIRNFIRYAYYNWQGPALSYVLLLGDGHYDYRHISLPDSIIVPVFEVFGSVELDSRDVDHYFAQLETSDNSASLRKIRPSIALGRIPVENAQDAEVALQKLIVYDENPHKDGWQIQMTFVADDTVKTFGSESWLHQPQTESLIKSSKINKYLTKKIYLSAYKSVPGGRRFLKPKATRDLLDQINNGTLLLNYVGHGSPTTWADETVFNFERDYTEINNSGKYTFLVAATCDFGEFDNPKNTSFTEALIWKPDAGIIGGLVSTRLVYSQSNSIFNRYFFSKLFPTGGHSAVVGDAFVQALHVSRGSNVNDQKFHLLSDPTLRLADPDLPMHIESIKPDTLKALSTVEIKAAISDGSQNAFNGGAIIVVNDAMYQHVNTGGGPGLDYNLLGPLVFRGEVSMDAGKMTGHFIVPKSIRYQNSKTGRITIYAWDENSNKTATAYVDTLLFLGSSSIAAETSGPQMDVYFDGQENFTSGDIIAGQPTLIIRLQDKSGINVTGQLGHKIQLSIDDNTEIDVSPFFQYDRDSFTSGQVRYAIAGLKQGTHTLKVSAFDNLNNATVTQADFILEDSRSLHLERVVNYPNPFAGRTAFTFQTNRDGADVTVKIYTINGRLIREINGEITQTGFNKIDWDGLDDDGNTIANGVYLYKIIISDGESKSEKIEKLVKVD